MRHMAMKATREGHKKGFQKSSNKQGCPLKMHTSSHIQYVSISHEFRNSTGSSEMKIKQIIEPKKKSSSSCQMNNNPLNQTSEATRNIIALIAKYETLDRLTTIYFVEDEDHSY